MTGYDICIAALDDAGIIGSGESPEATIVNSTLARLNRMLSSWSMAKSGIFAVRTDEFDLVGNQKEYTVGPTGNLVMPRPVKIETVQVRLAGNLDFTMWTPVSWADYQKFSLKTLANIPGYFAVNWEVPNIRIALYPAPLTGYKLRLTSCVPLDNVTLGDEYQCPPGYYDFIVSQLAVRCRSAEQLPPDQVLMEVARQAKIAIERSNFNSRIQRLQPDISAPGYEYSGGVPWWMGWNWGGGNP